MPKVKLTDLLADTSIKQIFLRGRLLHSYQQICDQIFISHITCHSKEVKKGSLFIAISGHKTDGHDFIDEVMAQEASVLILESKFIGNLYKTQNYDGLVVLVNNTRVLLSQMATHFYGDPSKNIQCIAVTGTNGKTTSVYMLETLLKALGEQVGVLSTIDHHVGNQTWPSHLTTPFPLQLHQRIFEMSQKYKITTLVMEVSSHALSQHRVDHLQFTATLWTHLTQDHLDYHHSMENYFKAKKRLFFKPLIKKNGTIAINQDDPWGQVLLKELSLKEQPQRIITYGRQHKTDVQIIRIQSTLQALQINLCYKEKYYQAHLNLVGRHNAWNFTGCLSLLLKMGYAIEDILKASEQIKGVPGRLELVIRKPFYGFVDYAHTSDALEQTLKSLDQIKSQPTSRIITVFGCGGNRDKTKRSLMAQVVQKYSDIIIITSDNPRNEDPLMIIKQIKSGLAKDTKPVFCIPDRKEAILKGIRLAQAEDILLIAGKGHENHQIIQGEKIPFSDQKHLQALAQTFQAQ